MLLTLFLGSSMALYAQKEWTLQTCIDYAMEHNITLQKARLQQQVSEEELKGAKAALLPSLSASSSQSVGFRPWQDVGVTTVTNGQVNTKVDKFYYNGAYGLNASWMVWNGNRNYNTVKQNRLAAEQAALETEVSARSIQERIAQLYVQVLYLKEAITVSEANLDASRKNEERGNAILEVGKMSKVDVAQLTAQRAADEYSVVEAKSQLATYTLQLRQLLELTDEQSFEISAPATTDEAALAGIPALQTVYEQALAERPEMKVSQLAIEQAALGVTMAKAAKWPTINMSGGFSTNTNSLSSNNWGQQLKSNFDAAVGLSLSVPLFDQRQTKTAVNKARLQQQQTQLDKLDKEKELYQTIETYWLEASTNQQKFKAALAAVASEQQSYDLLEAQFQVGLKNTIELMTGKNRLLEAQQNRLQSKYTALLSLQLLRFYQGAPLEM